MTDNSYIYGRLTEVQMRDYMADAVAFWLSEGTANSKPTGPDDWRTVNHVMARMKGSFLKMDNMRKEIYTNELRKKPQAADLDADTWWKIVADCEAINVIIFAHLSCVAMEKPPTTADKYFAYLANDVMDSFDKAMKLAAEKQAKEMVRSLLNMLRPGKN